MKYLSYWVTQITLFSHLFAHIFPVPLLRQTGSKYRGTSLAWGLLISISNANAISNFHQHWFHHLEICQNMEAKWVAFHVDFKQQTIAGHISEVCSTKTENKLINKSPGISIWKPNHVRRRKDKVYKSNTQEELYIWYKEDGKNHATVKNAWEVRDEECVIFQQSMNAWDTNTMNDFLQESELNHRRHRDPESHYWDVFPQITDWCHCETDGKQTEESQKVQGRRRGIWKWKGYIRNAWKQIKLRPASHVSRLIPKPRIFIMAAPSCVASHNNEVSREFQSTILWQNNKVPQLDVMAGFAPFCLWFIGFSALILLTFADWDCCSQSQCKQGNEYILLQCLQFAISSWYCGNLQEQFTQIE